MMLIPLLMHKTLSLLTAVVAAVSLVSVGQSAEPARAPTAAAASVPAVGKGRWFDFTDIFNNTTSNGTSPKFGKVDNFRSALAVDPATGRLFIARHFTGVWMSVDQARTFIRVDGGKLGGINGPFSCYSMVASPEGGQLAVFDFNNGPGLSGCSLDGGKTWGTFESVGRNWDYGAIDFDSRTLLALRHEHVGVHLSTDMGKTWTQLENLNRSDLTGAGVFSATELVVSGPKGIQRSEDGGKTWVTVADQPCWGTVQVYKGIGYWACNRQGKDGKRSAVLVATGDKGKTWREMGKPVEDTMFCTGPFFGRSEKHLVMATMKEILESLDGGRTWKKVVDYPADIPTFDDQRNGVALPGLAYDAKGDVFYMYFANTKAYRQGRSYRYAR